MKVQGIVSEYNPFHNGHLYHIRRSAEETGATHTVCVMSGNFVQRGEPAAFHKLARAEMALAAGVDLVLELPAVFACASAEAFASGAVATLEATGVVDHLCFGTESGDLSPLQAAAAVLADEPAGYRALLRERLDLGISFAAARQSALAVWMSETGSGIQTSGPITPAGPDAGIGPDVGGVSDTWTAPEDGIGPDAATCRDAADVLADPNNILAVEYLKALRRIGGRMQPCTIRRSGRGYNDPDPQGRFPSATGVRKALSCGVVPAEGLPEPTLRILAREMDAGRGPVFPEAFFPYLLCRLRTARPEELARLPWMEAGLEYRLMRAAEDAQTLEGLIGAVATSRYPRTRIRRILTALLIGADAALPDALRCAGHARYLRVLGFRESGRPLLAAMKRKAALPVLGRAAKWADLKDPLADAMLSLECRASDAWVLACREHPDRRGGSEQRLRPVRLP